MLLETRSWRTEIQRRLDREAIASMEVVAGGEDSLQVTPDDHVTYSTTGGLTFGPYGTSPLSGLHFENAEDTACS